MPISNLQVGPGGASATQGAYNVSAPGMFDFSSLLERQMALRDQMAQLQMQRIKDEMMQARARAQQERDMFQLQKAGMNMQLRQQGRAQYGGGETGLSAMHPEQRAQSQRSRRSANMAQALLGGRGGTWWDPNAYENLTGMIEAISPEAAHQGLMQSGAILGSQGGVPSTPGELAAQGLNVLPEGGYSSGIAGPQFAAGWPSTGMGSPNQFTVGSVPGFKPKRIGAGQTFGNVGFEKGGRVPATGTYKLHRGEVVVPKDAADVVFPYALRGPAKGKGKPRKSYQQGTMPQSTALVPYRGPIPGTVTAVEDAVKLLGPSEKQALATAVKSGNTAAARSILSTLGPVGLTAFSALLAGADVAAVLGATPGWSGPVDLMMLAKTGVPTPELLASPPMTTRGLPTEAVPKLPQTPGMAGPKPGESYANWLGRKMREEATAAYQNLYPYTPFGVLGGMYRGAFPKKPGAEAAAPVEEKPPPETKGETRQRAEEPELLSPEAERMDTAADIAERDADLIETRADALQRYAEQFAEPNPQLRAMIADRDRSAQRYRRRASDLRTRAEAAKTKAMALKGAEIEAGGRVGAAQAREMGEVYKEQLRAQGALRQTLVGLVEQVGRKNIDDDQFISSVVMAFGPHLSAIAQAQGRTDQEVAADIHQFALEALSNPQAAMNLAAMAQW